MNENFPSEKVERGRYLKITMHSALSFPCRSKNTVNILIKNMLDCLIGAIAYWSIGWGLAYGPGGNGFAGGSQFFSTGSMTASDYPSWFFQFVFAAAAATIVSGSIAERVQFTSYFVYSILITGELTRNTSCSLPQSRKGASRYDVRKICGFFDLLPPRPHLDLIYSITSLTMSSFP